MHISQNNLHWCSVLANQLRRPVVVSPGSRSTPLVLAYAAMPDVEVHCILDERAAAFFALGLARASGQAVVLVCTSGTAGAHYLPAVIEANLSGIPLIVLTADRPPELQHCGAPQTIDQTHLFGHHVRWFADVGTPHGDVGARWLRTIAAQALDYAEGAQRGPVHLNVPMREPLWLPEANTVSARGAPDANAAQTVHAPEANGARTSLTHETNIVRTSRANEANGARTSLTHETNAVRTSRATEANGARTSLTHETNVARTSRAHDTDIARALRAPEANAVAPLRVMRGKARLDAASVRALALRLSAEPRGVIFAGGMHDVTPELRARLGELAQRLGWPILAEPTSQLRTNDTPALREHVVSAYDSLLRNTVFADSHAPQLVLRFGQCSTSKIIGQWLGRHGADRTILVHPEGRMLDAHHAIDTLIVADPLELIADLLPHLCEQQTSPWLQTWQRAEHAARTALDAACTRGFWEAAVAQEVHARLPAGGALHVASSMPIRDLDSFAPPKDVAVFANRGANGIDGTLACALGTACGWKGGPVALLVGDLAFLHDVGALQLARQLATPLTVVVVNNGGGGIFDFLPIAQHPEHFERFFRTPQSADLSALAQAAGAHVTQVHSRTALGHALESSWQRPGLTVIEALMPEAKNNVARHRETWAAVADAVEADPNQER